MKMGYKGLLNYLCRKYRGVYGRQDIIRIIEEDGANALDKNIEYLGFDIWFVKKER